MNTEAWLPFTGLQRVGHNLATKQQQKMLLFQSGVLHPEKIEIAVSFRNSPGESYQLRLPNDKWVCDWV